MSLHFIDRIAVEIEGDGDAIICIHGLGGSANVWSPMLHGLSGYRIVRIELPGSARSSRFEGPLSISLFADLVIEVCSRLGIDRAHWMGHSLGTIVIQHIAAKLPKLVTTQMLLGPLSEASEFSREPIRARALRARTGGLSAMKEIADQLIPTSLSTQTISQQPVVVAMVRDSVARSCPEGYARSCEALADSRSALLEHIVSPTILITGDQDVIAPPQQVRALRDRLSSTRSRRVLVLSGCGHWTPLERPAECMREWKQFILETARLNAVSLFQVPSIRVA